MFRDVYTPEPIIMPHLLDGASVYLRRTSVTRPEQALDAFLRTARLPILRPDPGRTATDDVSGNPLASRGLQ